MEARKVFYRARHSPSVTYHVYIAAAEIELKVNKVGTFLPILLIFPRTRK